ncbi:hypothetical protein DL240_15670 [Lujinxingia litoralis]|uniref:Lipoprotein n=1 Tax=Lujinxingia litoralis TaxID=2211119 RepID=A0A328C6Y4_9DELT|nr:hypothetical protein [Lujinxingia litoralis]RAL20754.1 hypothetical protein DL240_15670 [Lujinxingia litoralis]
MGARRMWMVLVSALLLSLSAGCAMPEYVYMTDYQVVGERSVKYIYNPLYPSTAGSSRNDAALVLEVCSIDEEEAGQESACRETVLLRTEEYR